MTGQTSTRSGVAGADVDPGRFTVGVFQDVLWAERGLAALRQKGFPAEALTIIGKSGAEVSGLIDRLLGTGAETLDLAGIGSSAARGPMVAALQGTARDLAKIGLAEAMKRVGFQAHDGRIFEALVARGGVLVGIHSEPLAAEALALLHAYGGGNAAIGAWTGRV